MGFALTIIPAVMCPIIKRESEALAVGYVIFRGTLEMLAYIGVAICWLLLVTVAREAAGTAGAAITQYSTVGTLALRAQEPIIAVQNMVFATGGLMLYYALYRLRLVPRWLAVGASSGASSIWPGA